MVEIVTKITNLSYDQYLALTSPEEWGRIPVNVEHMEDSDIGFVREIYVEKGDENNVYAKIVINDAVYEKIRDYITGCSVEVVVVEQEDGTQLVVPTKCSILLGSEPAVPDAGKTILERVYSKIDALLGYKKEVNEMKQKYEELEKECVRYKEMYESIKKENEELKAQIEQYKSEIEKLKSIKLKSDYEVSSTPKIKYMDILLN